MTLYKDKVSGEISRLEKSTIMSSGGDTLEAEHAELTAMVKENQDKSAQLQWQAENMKLRNELEGQKLQQEQWEVAMRELKAAREKMMEEHQANLEQMKNIPGDAVAKYTGKAVQWLQEKLQMGEANLQDPKEKERQEKAKLVQDLHRQQELLQKQIEDITGEGSGNHREDPSTSKEQASLLDQLKAALGPMKDTAEQNKEQASRDQALLLDQLRAALGPKQEAIDQNKVLLKALLSTHNKTSGLSGTSTLRPELVDRLTTTMSSLWQNGWHH